MISKQELEEKIAKGESVWNLYKGKITEIKTSIEDDFGYWDKKKNEQCFISSYDRCAYRFNELFATKSEAEHYLHHANITRTETLPFLTWGEFKKGKDILFYNTMGYWYQLYLENLKIVLSAKGYLHSRWEATEENFYKAYDECVKLFKGEKK